MTAGDRNSIATLKYTGGMGFLSPICFLFGNIYANVQYILYMQIQILMYGIKLEKVFAIRKTRETELDGGTEDMESEHNS